MLDPDNETWLLVGKPLRQINTRAACRHDAILGYADEI